MASHQPVELVHRGAVAAESTRFGFTEVGLGLVPAGEEGREGARVFLEKRKPDWLAEADV